MKRTLVVVLLCVIFALSGWAEEVEKYPVELTVWDRLNITKLVPQKSTFDKAIIALDINKRVGLSQKEIEEFGIKATPGQIQWDITKTRSKTIQFSYLEIEMLRNGVAKMSDKGEIEVSDRFISLCRKIKESKCELSE